MLKVKDIRSGYGDVTVLHDLNFEVHHEIFAILGANGAGKSTLMKTIARVLQLKNGEIYFKENNISDFTSYQASQMGMAFVPQEGNVFPKLTVMENLSIGGLRLGKEEKKKKIEEVLNIFPGIADRVNQRAGSLSGGESQMVAFGRALMQDPEMILLDEPTAGLSPKYVDILFETVKEIYEEKKVSIIITEQNAAKALEIADKIMVLNLGRIHFIEDSKNVDIEQIKEGYCI